MYEVLSIFRFNDKDTRHEKLNCHKFSPLREVSEKLNETFQKYFRCSPHVETVALLKAMGAHRTRVFICSNMAVAEIYNTFPDELCSSVKWIRHGDSGPSIQRC